MATGVELLLATALCLLCPNETVRYPAGFLHLDENGEVTTHVELKPLEEKADGPLDDVPIETLETIALKAQKLLKLREWINGRHLRIATLEDYPLSYTKRFDNGTVLGLGVAFELIDFLKDKFNFTYEVLVPESNIIGSKTDFADSLIEMLNTTVSFVADLYTNVVFGEQII